MRLLLVSLWLAFSAAAAAAEGRSYAVLSLVGDKIMVSQYVASTGSRLDRNNRRDLELEDALIEKTSLLAVDAALKKAEPGTKPVLLFPQDGRLYAAQTKLLDEGGSSLRLLEYIRGLLQGRGTTHLILVTKLRHEARIKMKNATVGSGTLEGVGFYVDSGATVQSAETGELGTGFLGPFAYFRIALIDLARGEIVKEELVTASTAAGGNADAWNALSGRQKVLVLQDLLRKEIARTVPLLLATQSER